MLGWIQTVFKALALVSTVVGIVERPGEGAQKKAEVIEKVRESLPNLIPMPKWVRDLFLDSKFLGWAVDTVVWAANRYGFFGHTSGGEGSSSAS